MQQIAHRAQALVQELKERDFQGKHLAFYIPNSPELLCWQLAAFYLGIPIIPIIYEQDPSLVQEILQSTQARYLLTTSEKMNALSALHQTSSYEILVADDTHQALSTFSSEPFTLKRSSVSDQNLAMIIFSSGTSGSLKGIMHSYRTTLGFIQMLGEILKAQLGMVYVIAQPMGHIGGISTLLLTLLQEGTAILLDKFEVSEYLHTLKHYRPTHINLHTPLFYEILNYPELDKTAFDRLVTCFAGGDDIPLNLPSEFKAKTGALMQIGYGMTEIGIVILNEMPYNQYKGSCGKKINSALIILKDKDDIEKIVKTGETGEIWVQSPACCLGYWKLPELNKKTLVNGWFRTYDLAYQDKEGYYWYQGRMQDVIHRGQHVLYPQTLERCLFDYPGVKTAAVIGVPSATEGSIPIAFIELKSSLQEPIQNPAQLEQAILKYLVSKLPSWALPKTIKIIQKIPLNLTGKIDRLALKNNFNL